MATEASYSPTRFLTVAEYEAIEAATGLKHEYVLGEVYALAGATEAHNNIAGNIIAALKPACREAHCRVVGSDQKLQVQDDEIFYYPDIQVLCDPKDDDPLIKRRPCVIVEISSPSTRTSDHREKLLAYRGIESLNLYLIVATDRREVVVHIRQGDSEWGSYVAGTKESIEIPCLHGYRLSLDDIYIDVLPD